jgi:hypothetical protein
MLCSVLLALVGLYCMIVTYKKTNNEVVGELIHWDSKYETQVRMK